MAPTHPAPAPRPPSPAGDGPEARWLREVYQPGAPQLTLRAAVTGLALGALMALSNLYVVLKTGWSLGVTITACILAYGAFRLLHVLRLSRRDFGPLENNAMASVASSAGYMTGGGNMAALPALVMLTGAHPGGAAMVLWFAAIAALGVFVAIPVKRQLVNVEALPFPTGVATAETIRALHGHSEGGAAQTRLLFGAAAFGAVVAVLKDVHAPWMPVNLPETIGLPLLVAGLPLARWGLALETSVLLLGSGALVSFRTGWTMLAGAVLCYGVVAPAMVSAGVIPEVKYRVIVQWTLWGGAGVLVSSGLVTFAAQWRSLARAFSELADTLRGRARTDADPIAAVECPPAWFPLGLAALGPVVVGLGWWLFGIPLWVGVLALPLAVVLGFMAARITGETDTTPTKAFGPLTQLVYGGLLPGQLVPNLMGANVTGGVGLHAADLLTDLKSGWLLGAKPRQQLYAQLLGTIAGAAAIVPAFELLVPDASALGGDRFPAPGAQVWAGVSKVLAAGVAGLHPTARAAVLVGVAVGVALALAERWAPARVKPFVPSPSGLGLAFVIPGTSSVSIFLGATVAAALGRWAPRFAGRTVLPVASGLIAGESLMGIAIAFGIATGMLGS